MPYQTSDFPTAVSLLVLKHPLIGVDSTNPRRALFRFEQSDKLEADIRKIQSGRIQVDPLDFWNAQKRLKHILYDETGEI